MIDKYSTVVSGDSEQREQSERAPIHASCNSSRSNVLHGNTENNLVEQIYNPIDTPPKLLQEPQITRPCYVAHLDWYGINGKTMKPGLYWHGFGHKENESKEIDEWICSPLIVDGITSSTTGESFGRLLKFVDSNGQWHEWAMPMHMLKANGDELRGELLHQGLVFNTKRRTEICNYIMSAKPKRKIIAATTIGWHGDTFVFPNKAIGTADVVFQSETAGENDFQSLGTIEQWQENIGKLCIDNIPLIISIACALAGPLLKRVNRQQGGGIHWVGDSSSGKTTAIEIASSIYGPSEFMCSWRATSNGLEAIATTRNDTCLMLDEIDQASPQEIGSTIYMLGNGQGKQRSKRTGAIRKIQRWRIMTISTGERTLSSIMGDIDKQVNSGQLVRLINVEARYEHGVFSNLHGFATGRCLSDHLKSQRLKYYGVIGPAFVASLINDTRSMPELLDKIISEFAAHTNISIENRAGTVFAIIGLAGELGIEYGLLPWKPGSVLSSAMHTWNKWRQSQDSGYTEDDRILSSISTFIDKFGSSRFESKNSTNSEYRLINNRAGWYEDSDKGRVYMFTSSGLVEAGGNYERARIVDALKKAEWIVEHDQGRLTKKTAINGGKQNLYYVRIKEDQHES